MGLPFFGGFNFFITKKSFQGKIYELLKWNHKIDLISMVLRCQDEVRKFIAGGVI